MPVLVFRAVLCLAALLCLLGRSAGQASSSSTGSSGTCVVVNGSTIGIVPGVAQSFEWPPQSGGFNKGTGGNLAGAWPTNCLPFSLSIDAGIATAGGGVWDPKPGSVRSPDGSAQYCILQVAGATSNPAFINTTILSMTPGTSYYISFYYAPRGSFATSPYFNPDSLSIIVNGAVVYDLTDVSDIVGWTAANTSAFSSSTGTATLLVQVTSADPTNDWTILIDDVLVNQGLPTLPTPLTASVGTVYGFESPPLNKGMGSYNWQWPVGGTWPVVNATINSPWTFGFTSGQATTNSTWDGAFINQAAAEGTQYAFLETARANLIFNTSDSNPTISLNFATQSPTTQYTVSFQYSTRLNTTVVLPPTNFSLSANGQVIWSIASPYVVSGWIPITTQAFSQSSVPTNTQTSATNIIRLTFKNQGFAPLDQATLLDAVVINQVGGIPVSSTGRASTGVPYATSSSSPLCTVVPGSTIGIVPGVAQSFEWPPQSGGFNKGTGGNLAGAWPTNCLPFSLSIDAGIATAGGGVWDPKPGSVRSPDGSAQYCILQVAGATSNPAFINTTILSMTPGTSYYISFYYAPRGSFATSPYFNPDSLSIIVNGAVVYDLTDVSDIVGWTAANTSAFSSSTGTATLLVQVTSADPTNDWTILIDDVLVNQGLPTLPTPLTASVGTVYGFESPPLNKGMGSYNWQWPVGGTWPVVNATINSPWTFGFTSGQATTNSTWDGAFINQAAAEGTQYAFLETARANLIFNTSDSNPTISLNFATQSPTTQYTVSFQYSTRLNTTVVLPPTNFSLSANGQVIWSIASPYVVSGWIPITTQAFSQSSVPTNTQTSATNIIRLTFKNQGFAPLDQATLLDAVVINQSTASSSGALCFLTYALPGTVDYPWSVATSLTFTYNPNPVVTGSNTAYTLLTGTGTRTFTNRLGASFTTGVALVTGSSDNLLYTSSATSTPLDTSGLTLSLASPVQLPGASPIVLTSTLSLLGSNGAVVESGSYRIDGLGQVFSSNLPGFVNLSIGASNINSLAIMQGVCSAPLTFTNGLRAPTQPSASNGAVSFSYSYTISDGATYQVQTNLTVNTNSAFATTRDQLGNPYQTVTAVSGTRTYTYFLTGDVLNSTVTGLAPIAGTTASQRWYPYTLLSSSPGVYSVNTVPFVDSGGLFFSVTPAVPRNGMAVGSGSTTTTIQLLTFSTNSGPALLTEANYVSLPSLSFQQQQYTLS